VPPRQPGMAGGQSPQPGMAGGQPQQPGMVGGPSPQMGMAADQSLPMTGPAGNKLTQDEILMVKWARKGAERVRNGELVCDGKLRCADKDKQCGSIVSMKVHKHCQQEVYTTMNSLTLTGAAAGDTLMYFLHWSVNLQPQAAFPIFRISGENCLALKGVFKASSSEDSGGTIQCLLFSEMFDMEVVVSKEVASKSQCSPGQLVAFNAHLAEDGVPHATAVKPCEVEYDPPPGDLMQKPMSPNVPQIPGSKTPVALEVQELAQSVVQCMMQIQNNVNQNPMNTMSPMNTMNNMGGHNPMGGPPRRPTSLGQRFAGVIKTFNTVGNYAFIQCDALKGQYDKDVWCRGDLITGRSIGETVEFELGLNLKGQPQAMNIQPLGAPQLPGPQGNMLALTQGKGNSQGSATPEKSMNGPVAPEHKIAPGKSKWDQKPDDMASQQKTTPQPAGSQQQSTSQPGMSAEKRIEGLQRLQSMLLSTGKKVGCVVSYSAEIGCGFLRYISSSEQVFFGVDQNQEIAKQSAPESGEGCLFELGQKNSGEACAVNVLLLRGANADRMLQMSASFPLYTGGEAANGQQQQQPQQQSQQQQTPQQQGQQSSQQKPAASGEPQPAKSEPQPEKPEKQEDKMQQDLLQQQILQQLPGPKTQPEPAPSYM